MDARHSAEQATRYREQEVANVWYATALMPLWTLLPDVQGLAGAGIAGEVVDTHRCSCVSDVAFPSLANPLREYCQAPKQSRMKRCDHDVALHNEAYTELNGV